MKNTPDPAELVWVQLTYEGPPPVLEHHQAPDGRMVPEWIDLARVQVGFSTHDAGMLLSDKSPFPETMIGWMALDRHAGGYELVRVKFQIAGKVLFATPMGDAWAANVFKALRASHDKIHGEPTRQ